MKTILSSFFLKLLLLVFSSILFTRCNNNTYHSIDTDLPEVRESVLTTNKEFKQQILQLLDLAEQEKPMAELQSGFEALRITYKKIEWAVEYFMPHSSRFINGPALPEIEFSENTVIEPEGLQVLEEQIYEPEENPYPEIIRLLKLMLNKSGAIDSYFNTITINKAQAFDVIRYQIFRISSLGIAGFDTPISGRHLIEMPYALEHIPIVLKLLEDKPSKALTQVKTDIDKAVAFLKQNSDKNTFDFATFLSEHLHAISKGMLAFKQEQNIASVEVTSVIKKDAATLFDKNAYDVNAFVPGKAYEIAPDKIALGKELFSNPLLSKDNNRSCITCHLPEKAFTDGRAKALSLDNTDLDRNTPSLNYANFQHGQFWDMRSDDLEGQSTQVITNKDEMHGDMKDIIAKINQNPAIQNRFKKIYNTPKVEEWQLQNVLASYIRSLATFSSPFDAFMRGEKTAITERQKEGFNLFVGKANCASCHFVPFFNGTVPPVFSKTEHEAIGTAENAQNKTLSKDPGRGRFHPTIEVLQHTFKTPSIRNIAKTAPYMHNGGYQTLEQVMDFYNRGGGKGLGLHIEHQTLSDAPLNLTPDEISKIVEFMHALTDN